MKQRCRTQLSIRFVCLLLGLSVFSTACSPALPNLEQLAPLPPDICRVAVLPFTNETDFLNGDILLYRIFVGELVRSGNYILPLEGDVRKTFRELGLPYTKGMNLDQVRMLADRLDVDIVIGGLIVEMEENRRVGAQMTPSLAVNFQIFDADTGRILWTAYHRREGLYYQKVMHFGTVNTITGLASNLSREVLELMYGSGLKPCEK